MNQKPVGVLIVSGLQNRPIRQQDRRGQVEGGLARFGRIPVCLKPTYC